MVPAFEKIIKSFAIDTSGVMIVVIISIPLTKPSWLSSLLIGLSFFVFYFLPYFISNGQTFGKRVEKIKVVDKSGGKARLWRNLLRQLFVLIVGIMTFGTYYIVCFFFLSEKRQNRLPHDYLFQTKIIDLAVANRDKGSDGFNKTESMRKKGF